MGKKEKKSNIMLIGFMGSGKSTLGIRLSYKLKLAVKDTDKIIEERENMPISEIFKTKGEGYFRNLETRKVHILIRGWDSHAASKPGTYL